MIDSKLSILTWLAIANTTISSHNLFSISNTHAMLLPRQMTSTFHLDNLKFTKLTNIVSYQNLLISRCFTDRLSFFKLKSYGTLSFKSSVFHEGKFEAIGKNVHVVKTKFYLKSNNFFKVENSEIASYKFADFSTKITSKPALVFKNVKKVDIDICNFTSVAAGAMKTLNSESIKVYFGIFSQCHSDSGSAIYSDSKDCLIEQSYFIDCNASQSGGSLYFTENNLNSKVVTSYFLDNLAPLGHSIFNSGQLEVLDCYFTKESQEEVSGPFKSFENKFKRRRLDTTFLETPSDTPTASYWPIATVQAQDPNADSKPLDALTVVVIILITVLCVAFVVGIGFFIYWRMKKQRNTIYASEKEAKDENEMGTVEIKSRYSLAKIYAPDV